MAAGMRAASEISHTADPEKATRIFYFTDMWCVRRVELCQRLTPNFCSSSPNHLAEDTKSMLKMMEENAVKDVFTTFVGVGVDFNTDLVSQFARIKGCNWFCVQSPKAFKKVHNLLAFSVISRS